MVHEGEVLNVDINLRRSQYRRLVCYGKKYLLIHCPWLFIIKIDLLICATELVPVIIKTRFISSVRI